MPMEHSLSLNQSQRMELRLQMTTQMIQSIELLQLPLLALEEKVQQELEENPALELEEPAPGEGEVGTAPEGDREDERADRAFEERVADLEEEWNESLGSSYRPRDDGEDPKYEAIQNTAAKGPSLQDYLTEQLAMLEATPRMKDLAELIIGNLDAAGFLPVPLADVFSPTGATLPAEPPAPGKAPSAPPSDGAVIYPAPPVTPAPPPVVPVVQPGTDVAPEPPITPVPAPEEAEEALELVQSLDPPGVGARTLHECLLIQLRRSPGDTSLEERIVEHHFADLAHNRLPKVAKDLGISIERVKEAVEIIATMNPRPGALFGGTPAHYVTPDLVVEANEDDYQVRLNDTRLPNLRVSPAYLDMLRGMRQAGDDKALREYVQDKVRSARWLIEAIGQRRSTLLKIAREVVRLQKPFLDEGVAHLKPLPMQEVADRLGLHVSTVSRAMTDKHIQTPQGVFPLRSFITGGYRTADGEGESARAVMERIREMVAKETPGRPLTDQEIVKELRAAGLDIARRTVAKYREQLGIAGSRQRKKY